MDTAIPRLLNVGCGETYDQRWVNVDVRATAKGIIGHDIRKGLPFPADHFDACYSSHVLEHMTRLNGEKLLRECFRVLRPRGVIRIAVPDLEQIARQYLAALERAEVGLKNGEADHEWMMLEFYDQVVRDVSGGEMARYLARPDIENRDFVLARIGTEAERFWAQNPAGVQKNRLARLISRDARSLLQTARGKIAAGLVAIVAGKAAKCAYEEGMFRASGEIHRWMYDRFSLRQLMERVGFADVEARDATTSRIPGFDRYELDTVGGKTRKPDSLFMEGIKP